MELWNTSFWPTNLIGQAAFEECQYLLILHWDVSRCVSLHSSLFAMYNSTSYLETVTIVVLVMSSADNLWQMRLFRTITSELKYERLLDEVGKDEGNFTGNVTPRNFNGNVQIGMSQLGDPFLLVEQKYTEHQAVFCLKCHLLSMKFLFTELLYQRGITLKVVLISCDRIVAS